MREIFRKIAIKICSEGLSYEEALSSCGLKPKELPRARAKELAEIIYDMSRCMPQ